MNKMEYFNNMRNGFTLASYRTVNFPGVVVDHSQDGA